MINFPEEINKEFVDLMLREDIFTTIEAIVNGRDNHSKGWIIVCSGGQVEYDGYVRLIRDYPEPFKLFKIYADVSDGYGYHSYITYDKKRVTFSSVKLESL